jgi:hypothetical protein
VIWDKEPYVGNGGKPVEVKDEKLDRDREWGEFGLEVGEEGGASEDKVEGPTPTPFDTPLAELNRRLAGKLPRRAKRDGGIGAGRWLG